MKDRDMLLKALSALDFMAVDLHLYLDTHPHDDEARKTYNDIIREADKVREKYEKVCGPLCSYRSLAQGSWQWLDGPWPWQKDFNCKL